LLGLLLIGCPGTISGVGDDDSGPGADDDDVVVDDDVTADDDDAVDDDVTADDDDAADDDDTASAAAAEQLVGSLDLDSYESNVQALAGIGPWARTATPRPRPGP
jgi:hypothetical protein